MYSVTTRAKMTKQPRGGYLKLSNFTKTPMGSPQLPNDEENIHASIIGMVVEYLTKVIQGCDKKKAFQISLEGADRAESAGVKNAVKDAKALLAGITGSDDLSIINACKLATFDVWFRSPLEAMGAKTYQETNPDKPTIENIRALVERSLAFFEAYGDVVQYGFTFEPYGYTDVVSSGDGDFLTADTLWDFKVLKTEPAPKHTLQLLMYWIMGKHSGQKVYENIKSIGFFNPRLNMVYTLEISSISKALISEIEEKVICY